MVKAKMKQVPLTDAEKIESLTFALRNIMAWSRAMLPKNRVRPDVFQLGEEVLYIVEHGGYK